MKKLLPIPRLRDPQTFSSQNMNIYCGTAIIKTHKRDLSSISYNYPSLCKLFYKELSTKNPHFFKFTGILITKEPSLYSVMNMQQKLISHENLYSEELSGFQPHWSEKSQFSPYIKLFFLLRVL